jgi:hypothetical protein
MAETDTPAAGSTQDARRLRLTTPDEQREFTRIARRLLDSGVSEDELRAELGYEEPEAFRHAVENGRATTVRLERLRELGDQRLPDLLREREESSRRQVDARMERLAEQFRTRSEDATRTAEAARSAGAGAGAGGQDAKRGAPADAAERGGRPGAARRGGKKKERSARKEYLSSKQHARLREQVEHLWAVDKQFRNWSLLAKVAGLSSGQAAKRAYEVNSSLATLQNIDLFSRMHAGFGSRATNALKAGVTIEELQDFLTGGGAHGVESKAAAAEAAPGATARPRRARGAGGRPRSGAKAAVLAASDVAPEPPPVDAANLLEIAAAIDAEMKRLWEMVRFFDGVAGVRALPRAVRQAAADTQLHLRRAVAGFAGEPEEAPAETETAPPETDTAETDSADGSADGPQD